ncbi:MAG: hypothetical protein LQ346_002649 [Caloplaca aetnensis]|nr:MAG: hypothetical protein LQ346_002649 [Caloplaca aetnensis]
MTKTEGASAIQSSTDSNSEESKKTVSGHAARYAKVYRFFGFGHAYNFPLCMSMIRLFHPALGGDAVLTNTVVGVIFAGGMLGFSLSRLSDLDYDNTFKNGFALVPGYWYDFHHGRIRVGMLMHLATVLPAGILLVLQFTPVIRHRWILFHRMNGYTILTLFLISNGASSAVLPHKQGGGARTAAQSAEAFLVIITTLGMAMAWWNIRRKQIDQHRAWMLRTMFYFGTIITSRIINFASAPILSRIGNYYGVWSCDELDFLYKHLDLPFPVADYPQCFLPDGSLDAGFRVAVKAAEVMSKPEQFGSSHIQPFGANVSLV